MKNPVGDKKKRFDILIFEVIEYFSLWKETIYKKAN